MTAEAELLRLRVHRLEWAAQDILTVDLRDPAGCALPAFMPGAHVDLRLPNGMSRSYSLANDCLERHRYVLGVALDAATRGGSRWIHRDLRVGHILDVGAPRNHFPLVEEAPHSVLIAGGIGVTPMLAMAKRLGALRCPFEFHYAVREHDRAAFLDELRAARPDMHLHVDAEAGGPLDIAGIVARAPPGAHFYCCGPGPMLAAYEKACAALPPDRVHLEYFQAKAPDLGLASSAFEVELSPSGRRFEIPEGRSILEVLQAAGVRAPHSCQEGICGECETKVILGEPDHRDSVLTAAEKQANRTMMICVSRAKSARLVLELD